MKRKVFALCIALAMLAMAGCGGTSATDSADSSAPAAKYPTQPIRIIIPYNAGGNSDLNARVIADIIGSEKLLPTTLVVVNIPGSNTNEACDTLKKANPDGYTLLFHQSSMLSMNNMGVCETNYYDMQPITEVAYQPTVCVVPKNSPYNTAEELVAAAKANPKKLIWGRSGVGGSAHLGSMVFWKANGIEDMFTHVVYSGGAETITALMGSQIDVGAMTASEAARYVKSGDFKPIYVSSESRIETMPDVPSFGDLKVGESFLTRQGFFAPKGTPVEVLNVINEAIQKAMATDRYKEFCKTNSLTPSNIALGEWEKVLEQQNKEIAALVKTIKK